MKKRTTVGFTLVELMIVVAIVGLLAVIAASGVRKYITNAKTAEARSSVGLVAKLAAQSFEKPSGSTTTLTRGTSETSARLLCGTATLTPSTVPAGVKYQSSRNDWNTGNQKNGWQCLRFTMSQPQYFAYDYQVTQTTSGAPSGSFTALAHGNLDGTGGTSRFELRGVIDSAVTGVRVSPAIQETNPDD